MKRKLIVAAAVAVLAAAASAWSQPYGMGPGMMGRGYGPGYGMGPGMMGGYGMGPGMMWGYGPGGYGVDLSVEQRAKLAEIQRDLQRKHWDLMGKLHEQGSPMYEAFASGILDEQALARGAHEEAIVDGIKEVSLLLARHYPPRPGGRNELPDKPVVL